MNSSRHGTRHEEPSAAYTRAERADVGPARRYRRAEATHGTALLAGSMESAVPACIGAAGAILAGTRRQRLGALRAPALINIEQKTVHRSDRNNRLLGHQ